MNSRIMKPGTVILMIVLAVTSLVTGCGEAETTTTAQTVAATTPPVTTPAQLDSYTIADSTGDWGYPSPYAHYSRGPGYIRMSFVFETLVWKNQTEFVPQLAKSWAYNDEDNSYTFELQQNVTWHDGTPFTADDVVFTFTYTEEHPYQWVDNGIVESVEALDSYTVKLYLSKPCAPFFQDVAGAQPIFPKHIWEPVTVPEEFLDATAVIGTGPYTLADYSKEHGTYLYKAWDNYYLGTPAVKELRFVKIAAEMAPTALKDGAVDAASIPAEVVEDIRNAGFTVITDNPNWNAKLTINHTRAPLDSKEFRQAVAYAIDCQALVQVVLRGQGVPGSTGLMPPTSVWYNPNTPQFGYDLSKARSLLEGLGYTRDGNFYVKDGAPLHLDLIAAADYKDLGNFIANALEEAGIDIDFQTMETKTVDSRVESWDFDLSIYGHGGIFEASILQRVIIGSGFNSARYTANTELTELCNAQLTEMDPALRKDMVFRIQALYAEDMPALTLYYPTSYWAFSPELELCYTMDGVAIGVPIALNRMDFIR